MFKTTKSRIKETQQYTISSLQFILNENVQLYHRCWQKIMTKTKHCENVTLCE